jgi:hypothetical protein
MGTVLGLAMVTPALADLIPPGHKGVTHQLVFVDSAALAQHRLVAAPVRGLQGTTEVVAGQSFSFSSKYGTRLYVIPKDIKPLPEFDRELYSQWPSAEPPVSEIRSVPLVSPVASILTTVRLVDVTSGLPILEVVEDKEFEPGLTPVSWKSYLWRPLVLVPVGIAVLLLTVCIMRRRRAVAA